MRAFRFFAQNGRVNGVCAQVYCGLVRLDNPPPVKPLSRIVRSLDMLESCGRARFMVLHKWKGHRRQTAMEQRDLKPSISLCTYTYNDASFVWRLLESVSGWNILPDEIVVVDDGSEEPFVASASPVPLRILRLDPNAGITRAKSTGLSAACMDLIFSIDCDTRVAPDWLEVNLPHVMTSEIGLVGGALQHSSGSDTVSRYFRMYGDNHNLHHTGDVSFIPGNAFLMRREVWEAVGGFGDYAESTCEDHELCRRMQNHGYRLFSDCRAQAAQTRRVSRFTLCRRVWKWCHATMKEQMLGGERTVPYLFETCAKPMLERFEASVAADDLLLVYIDLLYLAYTVADLLAYGVEKGLADRSLSDGFRISFLSMCAGFPVLERFLRADMGRLGVALQVPPGHSADVAAWNDFFMFAPVLRESGLLQWLQTEGVPRLLREDAENAYDFSAYDAHRFHVDR